ncbi:MAG: TlpA disulfide reductase family protein [Pseudomonadota bacterium]
MRKVLIALVYTALTFGANTALASDISTLEALRDGDMKKLSFHSTPRPVSAEPFAKEDGAGDGYLSDYKGKYVLLNFWATWCAPCRKEMPHLSDLQTEFGGDTFEVVTLATGRNSPTGIKKFLEKIGVDNLPRHQDGKQHVARDMAVLGLPITVLINPDGEEIARMQGDADWYSDSARAIIETLIATPDG